jgi:hypothetical protein
MLNRIMNMALGAVIGQLLKQKIRNSSIQAVKSYIQLVKGARAIAMALVAIGAVAAVIVAGIMLTVVGLVGLLPVDPNTVAIIILCIGLVMTLAAGIAVYGFFNEKRWLEMSKAYDLMDAALAPWDGILPPNPVDVVKGETHVPPAPTADEIRASREIQLTQTRTPAFTRGDYAPST